MIRYVVLPLLAIIALIVTYIYLGPGKDVSLTYDGITYTQELRYVVLGLVAIVAAIIALWSLIVWLWQLPGRIKSGMGLRRRDRALTAMEDALIAGAEGNIGKSRKTAEKARGLIESPRLGRIISAQAAEAAGDREEVLAQYTAMLDDPKTVPTAQRGLAQAYMTEGDYASAIEHAHLAYSQNRDASWAFDVLFRAQVAAHCWADALATLSQGEARKHVSADTARRRRVVLETAQADRFEEMGRAEEARELSTAAAMRDPQFAPGVALAARLLSRIGETRRARKLIEAAWSRRPHPALGMAYRDVIEGTGKGGVVARFSRKSIEDLIALNPEHRESKLLEVEQALSAEEFVQAWTILSSLLEEDTPSSRVCLLAARCEAGLGNTGDAKLWMERAATAPTEGDWSDLDPSGDAFTYGDPDWHRLVFSYGDRGELIHPRLESNAPTRLAIRSAPEPGPAKLDAVEIEPVLDEPEISVVGEAEPDDHQPGDIARRLDKLLDKGPST